MNIYSLNELINHIFLKHFWFEYAGLNNILKSNTNKQYTVIEDNNTIIIVGISKRILKVYNQYNKYVKINNVIVYINDIKTMITTFKTDSASRV